MTDAAEFEAEEVEVLEWLLRQDEVSRALVHARAGREDAAVSALLHAVQGLLDKESPERCLAPVAPVVEEASPAKKRRKAEKLPAAAGQLSVAKKPGQARAAGGDTPQRAGAAAPVPVGAASADSWLAECRRSLEVERVAEKEKQDERKRLSEEASAAESAEPPERPIYWKIDVPEVAMVLTQRGILPEGMVAVEGPHITLLYLGGPDLGEQAAAKRAGLTVEGFQAMRKALHDLDGETVEVRMLRIVIEESVACAVVTLPPAVPCTNSTPHVTLGTKPGVPPRYANDVLEEVAEGRQEGMTIIDLPKPRPLKGVLRLHYDRRDAS